MIGDDGFDWKGLTAAIHEAGAGLSEKYGAKKGLPGGALASAAGKLEQAGGILPKPADAKPADKPILPSTPGGGISWGKAALIAGGCVGSVMLLAIIINALKRK